MVELDAAGLNSPTGVLRVWLGRLIPRSKAHAVWLGMVACVLVGVWLRTRGALYAVIPLWLDEASWANSIMKNDLIDPSIRPIGFMALSKALVTVFGGSEVTLRFLPWLCGVSATILSVPLARQLFRAPAARLLLVASISLHPGAIDLCKEFKPYSVTLFLHLSCLLGALLYWELGTRRYLWATVLTGLIGILFAQDLVFAFPGLYLALGIRAWQARRTSHVVVLAVGAVMTIALVFAQYWLIWRHINRYSFDNEANYWGRKYDVFYVAQEGGASNLGWTVRKWLDLAAFPGMRRDLWAARGPLSASAVEFLRHIDYGVWVLLHVIALGVIAVGRRLREALLLLLPLVLLCIFNLLRFWPFGVFRTNLFALVYTASLAALALDVGLRQVAQLFDLVPATLLVVMPLLGFERDWHKRKETQFTLTSVFPETLASLFELQGKDYTGPRESLVLDSMSCILLGYYTTLNPHYRMYAQQVPERFELHCEGQGVHRDVLHLSRNLVRKNHNRVWLVVNSDEIIGQFEQRPADDLKMFVSKKFGKFEGQGLVVGFRGEKSSF
jgi:4-amino-4-deoxy-L-arabinose transferase-like glycosyltransferase